MSARAVLAIDTAGHACSIALIDEGGQTLFSESQSMARGHAAALAPLTARALEGFDPARIGALAVTRGPGGFTGMRAGLAYARGFALAHKAPVYGFSVFEALRLSLGQDVPCLIDSRRGDFFYDAPTARILGLEGATLGILGAAEFDALNWRGPLAGSIWRTDQAPTTPAPSTDGWVEPCAIALATAGQTRLLAGTPADPALVSPLYVRAPSLG